MSERQNKNQANRDWLLKMANLEDSVQSISAGGMAEGLGMLTKPEASYPRVLSRLIELARRKLGYTVEKLAEDARVDLMELVNIEDHEEYQPSVRTIYQLSSTLNLPAEKLLALAGLVEAKPNKSLGEAAIRFAARSETNAKLTRSEKEALDEFVKVLVEGSD